MQTSDSAIAPALDADQLESRYEAEVAHIESRDLETKLQSGDPNRKVLEADGYALSGLLTFDPTDHACNLNGNGMHGDVATQPIYEGDPPLFLRIRFGAVRSVHQFGNGYDGEADVDIAVRSP